MNKETVRSVKGGEKKSMSRNAIQLNTVTKERTNEEGLMNHRNENEKTIRGGKRERMETSRPACN